MYHVVGHRLEKSAMHLFLRTVRPEKIGNHSMIMCRMNMCFMLGRGGLPV